MHILLIVEQVNEEVYELLDYGLGQAVQTYVKCCFGCTCEKLYWLCFNESKMHFAKFVYKWKWGVCAAANWA